MLEELRLGVFGTEKHLAKIRDNMATREQMDAMGRRMMDKLKAVSSAQEELGRGQAEMNAKLDDAGKERADMNEKLGRGQAAMDGKLDAAGKERAEMNEKLDRGQAEIKEKLDGLAASQDKRRRAKSERREALEDAEIPEADIVLDLSATLGFGGFAKVFKGLYKKTPVAIKVIDTASVMIPELRKLHLVFVNEVGIMRKLSHPSIIGTRPQPAP
jgi:hypothetical protein